MSSDFEDRFGHGKQSRPGNQNSDSSFSSNDFIVDDTSESRPSLRELLKKKQAQKSSSSSDSRGNSPGAPKKTSRPTIPPGGAVNFAALIGEARKNLNADAPGTTGGLQLDLKKARDEASRVNQEIEASEGISRHRLVEEMVGGEAPSTPQLAPPSLTEGGTEALFGFRGDESRSGLSSRPEPTLKVPPPRKARTEKSMIRRINELASSDLQEKTRADGRRGTSGVLRLPDTAILEEISKGPSGPYRIRVDDLEYGPTDSSVIIRLVEQGLITGADEISKSAWGGWQRLEQHPLFINYLERPFDAVLQEDTRVHSGVGDSFSNTAGGFQFPDDTRPANASYDLAKNLNAIGGHNQFSRESTEVEALSQQPLGPQEGDSSGYFARNDTAVQGPVLTSPMRPARSSQKGGFTEVSVSDIAFQLAHMDQSGGETPPPVERQNSFEQVPFDEIPSQLATHPIEPDVKEQSSGNRTNVGHETITYSDLAKRTGELGRVPSEPDVSDFTEEAEVTRLLETDEQPSSSLADSIQNIEFDDPSVSPASGPVPGSGVAGAIPTGPPGAVSPTPESVYRSEDVQRTGSQEYSRPGDQFGGSVVEPPLAYRAAAEKIEKPAPSYDHQPLYDDPYEEPRKSEKSPMLLYVGIAAIVLLAVGGAYFLFAGGDKTESGDVVAVNTEKAPEPTKEEPAAVVPDPTPSNDAPEQADQGGADQEGTPQEGGSEQKEGEQDQPAEEPQAGDPQENAIVDEPESDSGQAAADDAPAFAGDSDSIRAQRLGILNKLASSPTNASLMAEFDSLVKQQAENPPSKTLLSSDWGRFRVVGRNPTILQTKDPSGRTWEFIPEHDKGPSWRGDYAFYQLCGLVDCGFEVPEVRLVEVTTDTLDALSSGDVPKDWMVKNNKVQGLIRLVPSDLVPFQIEDTSIWRNWLSRRTPMDILRKPMVAADFTGASFETRTELMNLKPTIAQVAIGVGNILAADYLTNNFGRFARHRSDYGQNVRFSKTAPLVLIAMSNQDAFQARESTRVRGRFNWSDRIGKSFVESVRRLKPEYVNEVLFPNITAAEKAAMSVFWEQRSELLNSVDRRVESYTAAEILL